MFYQNITEAFFMRHIKINQAKRTCMNLLIIIGVYLLLSLIACIIMLFSSNPTGNIFIFSLASFLASGAVSGFVIGKLNKESRAPALIAPLLFSLILIVAGIFSSGKLLATLINCLAYTVVYAVLLFLSQSKKKRHRVR